MIFGCLSFKFNYFLILRYRKLILFLRDMWGFLQDELAAERHELERNRSLGEKERQKLQQDIAAKQEQLTAADAERNALTEKLSLLEKTIIVGGENLLDKAEEQERLLVASTSHYGHRMMLSKESRTTDIQY